jgi:GT2 family glycosyltransferase
MIAICVPCWNMIRYTRLMVESVLRNSVGHDIRLFFVDNGSKDGTYEYLSSLTGATVIRNSENRGVNAAWNQLLKAALEHGASIICLANNDILAGPQWLDPVTRELAKDDKRYFLPNGGFYDELKFDEEVRSRLPSLAGKIQPARAGWCVFFRADAVRLFLPIPERMKLWYGDDYFHWILGKHGYRCQTLMDSCCLHYVSKSVDEYPNKIETIEEDRKAFREITGLDV